MLFYRDPQLLFSEMKDASILITEHAYSAPYEQSAISGKYCVQFMFFKNDERGMVALNWWRERCLEWCYARVEDGKFGDQKYLDDWTTRFQGVHVLEHRGGGVAPWNVQQFNVSTDLVLTEKSTSRQYPLVFYHYHGLKFYSDGWVSCCGPVYDIDTTTKNLLYLPYIQTLLDVTREIQKKGLQADVNGARGESPATWKIYKEYMRDRLVLWKIGNVPLSGLRLGALAEHDHFYELKTLDSEWQN
jgi:hypothetical protein